jgi:hypothetical protein
LQITAEWGTDENGNTHVAWKGIVSQWCDHGSSFYQTSSNRNLQIYFDATCHIQDIHKSSLESHYSDFVNLAHIKLSSWLLAKIQISLVIRSNQFQWSCHNRRNQINSESTKRINRLVDDLSCAYVIKNNNGRNLQTYRKLTNIEKFW